MPQSQPPSTSGADATRTALIAAGLHLFGHKGFAAASTREIAARAEVNVAAIAYHFGGKEGLRLACADAVAERVGRVFGMLEAESPPADADADANTDVDAAGARARLGGAVRAMAGYLLGNPEAADLASFMLREMSGPGPVLDRLYSTTLAPRHAEICRLWGRATGTDPEAEETRLAVFSMIGQLVYFRIARPLVLRRMGWPELDAPRVADLLVQNLNAALDAASAKE